MYVQTYETDYNEEVVSALQVLVKYVEHLTEQYKLQEDAWPLVHAKEVVGKAVTL
jgi:hypothetical protein